MRKLAASVSVDLEDGAGWLQARGTAASKICSKDWSTTPLGPLESWHIALRSALNLILNSHFSLFIGWGDDLLCFYNDAYADQLQCGTSAIGRPLSEVFPEAMESVGPLCLQALSGSASFRESLPVSLERGGVLEQTWWTLSFSPIFDESGQICGVFVPVFEVTERVKAEADLRGSELSLKPFGNLVPSLLWRLKSGDEMIWANERARQIFGDNTPIVAVHPEDKSGVEREYERSRRERNAFHHYHRIRGKDGSYRWHLASSEPHFDDNGEIIEWCGVATDVHDLQTVCDALDESASLFRNFANHSSDVIMIADAETGRLDFVNPAFQRTWRPSPNKPQLDWDDWLSTIHPEDRPRQTQAFARLLSGEVLHEQYRIVRGDGTVRHIHEKMFPILAPDGSIHKIGGIARDITRRKAQIVHLVGGTVETRNQLSQRLRAAGHQVRPFATIDEIGKVCRALAPGCVVLLDDTGGSDAAILASTLKVDQARMPLIVMGDIRGTVDAVRLMKQGVCDIVLPSDDANSLEESVANALTTMKHSVSDSDGVRVARELVQRLSERERAVLEGLSEGATNKVLARDLNVSPRTVETYRVRIFEKLGVSTLPQAVKILTLGSLQHDLIEPAAF